MTQNTKIAAGLGNLPTLEPALAEISGGRHESNEASGNIFPKLHKNEQYSNIRLLVVIGMVKSMDDA